MFVSNTSETGTNPQRQENTGEPFGINVKCDLSITPLLKIHTSGYYYQYVLLSLTENWRNVCLNHILYVRSVNQMLWFSNNQQTKK